LEERRLNLEERRLALEEKLSEDRKAEQNKFFELLLKK
jgi:hypothetical protein